MRIEQTNDRSSECFVVVVVAVEVFVVIWDGSPVLNLIPLKVVACWLGVVKGGMKRCFRRSLYDALSIFRFPPGGRKMRALVTEQSL